MVTVTIYGSARKDLDVPQQRIFFYRDFVLDQEPAARAAELAELRRGIDEALGIADDRVGGLDRQIVARAIGLVVMAHRPEVGRAFRAAVVLVLVHRQVLGREEAHLAGDLAERASVALDAPCAQL